MILAAHLFLEAQIAIQDSLYERKIYTHC